MSKPAGSVKDNKPTEMAALPSMVGLDREDLLDMFLRMMRIRHFDTRTPGLVKNMTIPGMCHECIGHEAVAIGVIQALNPDDYIGSTHRGHGHLIAKGGDLNKMMAELMAKESGYCKGKGGSMHVADQSIGMLGADGIVGGGIAMIVGAGLSIKLRNTKQVAVSFHGDGAAAQGVWHESVNLAAVNHLPVLFVCENNLYALSTRWADSALVSDVAARAQGYGIPGVVVDGQDAIAVYEVAKGAVKRARSGGGPTLIECKTYRFTGHWIGDPHTYRTKEEVDWWRENRDPVKILRTRILDAGMATGEELDDLAARAHEEVEEAVRYGMAAPEPEPSALFEDVFAP
jgi:TPP-dependent pyruvate/acetoin dehydrogenase alpha subunit